MSKISRKELKTDELVLEVTKSVEFIQSHKQGLVLQGAIAVVLALAVGGGYWGYTRRVETANEVLGRAIRTLHSPIKQISLEDSPNDEFQFANAPTRDAEALRQFQDIAQRYSWLSAGKIARYYVGITQENLGNLPQAETELGAAMSSSNDYVAGLGRLALAGVQQRENKLSEAEQNLRYLVDHPTNSVPKTTAQVALAELLAPTKPAEAEKVYKQMESANPGPEVASVIRQGREHLSKR